MTTTKTKPPKKTISESAFGYLSRRPHARRELERKLALKGYGPGAVSGVLNSLVEQGYINDEETAARWAQMLVRDRCWGKGKVASYLRHKGIEGDIVCRVTEELWHEHSEHAVAHKAVEKRFGEGQPPPSAEKVAAFLKSRGFSAEVIYDYIRNTR